MTWWRKTTGAFAVVMIATAIGRAHGSGGALTPTANSTRPEPLQESSSQAAAEKPLRIRIGGNVAAASLTHKVMPVYPAVAKQAHVSGTVVLHCLIGKDGSVQALEYISGPPLLMKAAMDAVRQWTYKPILLNGEAVEVDTTVSVIFTLGGNSADSASDHPESPQGSPAPVGPEPKTNIQQGTKPFDVSQEPYVYETVRGTLRFENDGTGTRETRARIRIQSLLGVEKLGQLIFDYNGANERLNIENVQVIKPDGKRVITGPDSIQDLSAPIAMQAPIYSDARQKHVTVSGLAAGDILEYTSVNTTVKPLTPGQFWSSWKFINDARCLDEQVELSVPSNREIKIKNPPDVTPTSRIVGDRKIYTWKTTNERASETPLPPMLNAKQFDMASLLRGAQAAPSHFISFTSFENWQQVGKWYSNLERDRREPTADLKSHADEITKDAKTDVAKVQALYEYVTRNIRYVSLSFGVGRYQPHSAAEVLENRYGDCKDKATLLEALLEAEGIHSATALINSSYPIDPEVPTPSQFDHAITFVSVGGEGIWLDSTAQVAPFEYLLPQLRGRQALIVFPQRPAELKKTPERIQIEKYYMLEVNGGITEKKLALQLAFETRGDLEAVLRAGMVAMPPSQFAKLMSLGAKQANPKSDLEISEFKAGDPFDTTKPYRVELHMTMTLPDKASTNTTSSKPKLSATDVQEILSKVLPEAPASKTSLSLSGPERFGLKIKFILPGKPSITSFKPVHIVRDFAEFSANGSLDMQTLSADLELNIRGAEVPSDQIAQYTEFRTQVFEGLQHLMRVAGGEDASSAGKLSGSVTGVSTPSTINKPEVAAPAFAPNVQLQSIPQVLMLTPTNGIAFQPYILAAWNAVKRNWYAHMPDSALQGTKGKVILVFGIKRDGQLTGSPKVELSSRVGPLDEAAISAIRLTTPFSPFPREFRGKEIRLRITFLYNLPAETGLN